MLSAHPHCVDLLRLHVDGPLLAVSVFVDDAVDLAQQNLEPGKTQPTVKHESDTERNAQVSPLVFEGLCVRSTDWVGESWQQLTQWRHQLQRLLQTDHVHDLRLRRFDALLRDQRTCTDN